MSINPACINKTEPPFVKSNGSLLPCCWASSNPDIPVFLGEEKYSQLNMHYYSVDEIYSSDAYRLIKSKMLSEDPFDICKRYCGVPTEKQDIVDPSEIDDHINKYISL